MNPAHRSHGRDESKIVDMGLSRSSTAGALNAESAPANNVHVSDHCIDRWIERVVECDPAFVTDHDRARIALAIGEACARAIEAGAPAMIFRKVVYVLNAAERVVITCYRRERWA